MVYDFACVLRFSPNRVSFVYFLSLFVYIFDHLLGNDVAKPGTENGERGNIDQRFL